MNNKITLIEKQLSDWCSETFTACFPETDLSSIHLGVIESKKEQFGDYQCEAAMKLAKALQNNPRAIGQAFIDKAVLPDVVEKIEIAGPGFINIFLKNEGLSAQLDAMLGDDTLGLPNIGNGQTVIIDYSSPNVAKPMHIGHIRSTVIGNSLDRLYRALGYNVIADNHLGDWGTQFGLIILGYREFADQEALKTAPVEELERIYVESYNRSKDDDTWRDRAKAELVKLQQGDAENRALWEKFIELTLSEFNKIYKRLDVSFDLYRGESYYNDDLASVIDRLQAEKLCEESEGALICNLEDDNLNVAIVRKSDGGYNYTTTDIATVASRTEEFQPSEIIYVTDERQQLHFKQFFHICKKLGIDTKLTHVWFGLMRLPEATFSTREGNVIKLEALLDEAEKRALEVVKASSPDMDEAQQREVARAIGIGAIKYTDLSQNPQSLVTFTWEKALAMDGNSAPYLQYAYARIASVRDKYAAQFPDTNPEDFPIILTEEQERRLALKLTRFASAVEAAVRLHRPSIMADYLYDLSQAYSSFYQNVPFLKADEGPRESRIRICALAAAVLKNGLSLLGIETPERI
ncbi:arginine--tRNA ligase [Tichowtungia aerotolerans]|uniref:Arginine--tRNA ligase n=1 Tax=Tichowtungia aerotolerans TaxID=2697043 RepID=A0A6P1M8M9_9BACT|nr:arginine--tRNA ligase [Tichowtungia aerotolerans]QHI70241.1 arginine--tRNA ligase [Tichowtungia aerotolerans]